MKKYQKILLAISIAIISAICVCGKVNASTAGLSNTTNKPTTESAIISINATAINSNQQTQAEEKPLYKTASLIEAGSAFINQGRQSAGSSKSVDSFANDFLEIGQILAAIGVIVMVGGALILGAKWFVAKPDQKAKLKTQLIGFVVSAAVLFGAVTIWSTVRTIMENVESQLGERPAITTQYLAKK